MPSFYLVNAIVRAPGYLRRGRNRPKPTPHMAQNPKPKPQLPIVPSSPHPLISLIIIMQISTPKIDSRNSLSRYLLVAIASPARLRRIHLHLRFTNLHDLQHEMKPPLTSHPLSSFPCRVPAFPSLLSIVRFRFHLPIQARIAQSPVKGSSWRISQLCPGWVGGWRDRWGLDSIILPALELPEHLQLGGWEVEDSRDLMIRN